MWLLGTVVNLYKPLRLNCIDYPRLVILKGPAAWWRPGGPAAPSHAYSSYTCIELAYSFIYFARTLVYNRGVNGSVRDLIHDLRTTLKHCSGRVYIRRRLGLEEWKVFELCLSSPRSRENFLLYKTQFDVYFDSDSIHHTTTIGVYNSPKIVCRGGYYSIMIEAFGLSIVAYTVFYCAI